MRKRFTDMPEAVQVAHVGARGHVRAAAVVGGATLLGAVAAPVAGVILGLLQYTGPGGSEPSTQALFPETRTVTVTASPGPATSPPPQAGATYLVDLQAVTGSSGHETGLATINTAIFGRSVTGFASCRQERQVEFPLDRRFTEFSATVGPSNESQSSATIAFAASVDGRRIDPVFVVVGSSGNFTIDITDGFRLVLTYISSEFPDGSCPNPAVAAWGDARLT